MSRLLDTHCHLDAYANPKAVLADAQAAYVDVVAVSETPEGYRRLKTRLGPAQGVVVALGLHPASAAAAARGQLERFLRMLPDAAWIGEVGLDFRAGADRREKVRQIAAFQSILDHEIVASKPMSVHSRGASKEAVESLMQTSARAVLHWYSGTLATADDALAAGLWFSVNPSMIRTQKGQALISRLPRDRTLCETDGPYGKVGSRPALPSDIHSVALYLSRVWQVSEEEAVRVLAGNADVFATTVAT